MFRKGKAEYNFHIRNFEFIVHLHETGMLDSKLTDYIRESEEDFYEILKENKELKKTNKLDEKTGLLRYKENHLESLLHNINKTNSGLSKVMISLVRFDLDNFSSLNSTYGHSFGDSVLNTVAEILSENSRPDDLVIRYGGEEFDVIIPSEPDNHGSEFYCKRVINIISNTLFTSNKIPVKVTASAGVTSRNIKLEKYSSNKKLVKQLYDDLQSESDNALYEAKYNGKNTYTVYSKNKLRLYSEIRNNYKKDNAVNQ